MNSIDNLVKEYADTPKTIPTYFLYSLGYGVIDGTWIEKRDAFRRRLNSLAKAIGKLWIVDIRKEGSGSQNGEWFRQAEWADTPCLLNLVTGLGTGNLYTSLPFLSNEFGNTKSGLERYRKHLKSEIVAEGDISDDFCRLLGWIGNLIDYKVVLLCGCGKAMETRKAKPPLEGEVATGDANCHRVPLANLLKEYFANLNVVHL